MVVLGDFASVSPHALVVAVFSTTRWCHIDDAGFFFVGRSHLPAFDLVGDRVIQSSTKQVHWTNSAVYLIKCITYANTNIRIRGALLIIFSVSRIYIRRCLLCFFLFCIRMFI